METVTENYQKLSKYTANSVVSKLSKFTDNLRKRIENVSFKFVGRWKNIHQWCYLLSIF